MNVLMILITLSCHLFAQSRPESFVIQIQDRSMIVLSPQSKKPIFSVLVENRSLSDQVAKFIIQGKLLKHVAVRSGQTETIEIENKTNTNVFFVPISPAFQEVELIFDKKVYEIPSKK